MTQDEMKKSAAVAALKYVEEGSIIGIGTGSTVNYFIDALASVKDKIKGAVSSSNISTKKLKSLGIKVFDCNDVIKLNTYIDSADEINPSFDMIKGGGAALTREKIISAISETFVCIVDKTKLVNILGNFPLPVEIIPMARSYVARQLLKLGGDPVYRAGTITDNNNVIVDVYNLKINDAKSLENQINAITGVVTVGLFANRGADIIITGTPEGVQIKSLAIKK
ncbi:ribose-5-phosphate isomerase RpiA [Candidatus Photodesmus anomalopis]|uniref:Ribose-5-phosphate isomerase A n=2 Tax=Candidatus Photodesmus anomalopis TaxID=28176 RepID=S3EGN2_9GAMM|nr:ribose-5-phosphate isomerase RpiA [Candidatus Photodesmus katoptron]EPE37308.1 ribose -phosphate isomerase A [Candidatus Photodesmus katoptron Akat1]